MKKGFTLVELIVVITILAILGTIAFISLNNFSASARDAKRLSDIRSLYTKLTLENVKGRSYEEMIIVENKSDMIINGETRVVAQGVVNFDAIRENRNNFLDPSTNTDYPVAFHEAGLIASLSTPPRDSSVLEIATYSEENNLSVVVGNYFPQIEGDTPGLIKDNEGNIIINKGEGNYNGIPKENPLASIPDTIYGDEGKTERDICNKWITDNIPASKGDWIWVPAREEYFETDGVGTAMTDPYYQRKVEFTSGTGEDELTREFTCLGFAVAKYEMSHDDTSNPDADIRLDQNTRKYNSSKEVLSISDRYPIADIDQEQALEACKSIGLNFHLITNNEWMTIARNIEQQPNNWSGKSVGNGYISNGLSNDAIHGCIATNDINGNNVIGTPDGAMRTNDIYPELTRNRASKTGNTTSLTDTASCNNKRQLTLSNGSIIWDLSGNIWEHVNKDNTIDGTDYNLDQTSITLCSPTTNWDSTTNGCWDNEGMDIYRSDYGPLINGGTDYGLGNVRYSQGVTNNVFLRGSRASDGIHTGIFTFGLGSLSDSLYRTLGFRCSL